MKLGHLLPIVALGAALALAGPALAESPSEVVYGVSVFTLNPSLTPPDITLAGDCGTSARVRLDNPANNLDKNEPDYYVFAGDALGFGCEPTKVTLDAMGNDGWEFRDFEVDYYAAPGLDAAAQAKKLHRVNDRAEARSALGHALRRTVVLQGPDGLDGNAGRSRHGTRLPKSITLVVPPRVGASKPGFSERSG